MFGVLFRLLSRDLDKRPNLRTSPRRWSWQLSPSAPLPLGAHPRPPWRHLRSAVKFMISHSCSSCFFLWSSHKDWNAFPLMWVWIPAGFKTWSALSVFPAACCFTRSSFFSLTGFCKAWYVVFGSAFHAPSASAKGPSWIQRSTNVHDCQTQSIRILQENWIWRCLELNLPNTMFQSSLLSCANLNLGAIERHWLPTGRSSCQNPWSKGVLNAG